MKIAIIGRTKILLDTINLFLKNKHEITLIITANEAPEYKASVDDFKNKADEIGARFLCTHKINSSESIDFIKKSGTIEIGVSLNYINIISQNVIDIFKMGILNAHGGDLPKYRGNACQAWAIINGEKRIGLCIHRMIGGVVDSGNIIEREYFDIDINTKITESWNWMTERIPEMFLNAIKKIEKNNNYFLEQQSDNPKDALRCYPRIPEDGKINWYDSNTNILRLINASNKPYSGAYCFYNDKKIIMWDAELFDDNENYLAMPGQIVFIKKDDYIIIITGAGKLKINVIEYNGFIGAPGKIIKSIRKRLY